MSKVTIDIETKTIVRVFLVTFGLLLVFGFIYLSWVGIMIVLASIFLAVALKPLARKIDYLINRKKKNESLSSILAVVVVVVGLAVIIGIVGPVIVEQVSKFVAQAPANISGALDNLDLEGIEKTLGTTDLKGQIIGGIKDFSTDFLNNLSSIAFSSIGAISNALTISIFIIVLTILFMLEGPRLMDAVWGMFSVKNKEASAVSRRIADRISDVISTYVSRQLLIAVFDGIFAGILVAALGLIFNFGVGLAIPLGLVSTLMYLIPMFGPVIAAVINSVILCISSPWAALIFLVVYIIYEQIENNIIAPHIQSKGMALSPLIIFISITIGMYAFGLIGCIISIPVAGCIRVLIDEYPNIIALREKKLSEGK